LGLVSEPLEISESAVADAVDAALAAVRATTTVAELKQARAEHTGEQSPLARMNASMRSVPPEQKAAAGKLVGQARGRVNAAIAEQESVLAVAEERARLEAERVDVTALPVHREDGFLPTSSSAWGGKWQKAPSSSTSGSTSTR
jgi:phenylalanyl-tRNA synthetase alpha chain